jgi:branched-chain amino acid transport system substrate-binding protein
MMLRFMAMGLAGCLAAGAASAQLSDNVIKIGVLNDQTSLYADAAGKASVEVARWAAEDFGGKVGDVRIEVIGADHQNKADVAAQIAKRWIDQEKVDVIADFANSAVALAIQEIGREKKRVSLISSAGSSAITGKACSPYVAQWTYDTYALANSTASAVVKTGKDSWFMIAADYTFGHALEADARGVVERMGGKMLGGVHHPLNTQDYSSYLLQAQASKAKVIGIANTASDLTNTIKQAAEFGIVSGGQSLAAFLMQINDVNALGLQAAQGLLLTEAFYWDMNDETRAFGRRFFDKFGRMPTMVQAGLYSAVTHYLKAVAAAGTDQADAVMAKMRAIPVNDFFAKNGHLREDGLHIHDMYLFQVKKPSESKQPWDFYTLVATIKGEDAFLPADKSECPLLKKPN